ncbi:hypothetical protein RM863_11750 [Streptomyces sp. DSM 41014]|uniref:Uncharacterized protein n=1 Tax=Streptomyces hintoniae TaxID=3075521 RepID=A0ABU2UI12_9ACTN|nr:hypothetical protein [Streptomyces sp. DSM 41014]MDT0472798.1 hypothetical protein [Streptomyces sp. DSM 41014]
MRVIVDNPHAYGPKFPRVIEAETDESLDRRVLRCLQGMKGQYSAAKYAKTTVTRVRGTEDLTARYVLGGAE